MSGASRRPSLAPGAASGRTARESALAALGLAIGEPVRFRRADRTRWQDGAVQQLERDGSIGLTDANGAARAVPIANVLVRVRKSGVVSRTRWEPLADRAGRAEQLTLL